MRKSVRTSLLIAMLSLTLVGFVSGEGSQETSQAQKTVSWLHIWGAGTEHSQITKSIDLFEKANPDVKVNEIVLDASTWQPKLLQMLAGNNAPDIFLWYPGPKTYDLVDRGALAPITEMWKNNNLDGEIPAGLKAEVSYKGQIWNLPWGYHPTVVYYSKKMFAQLGVEPPTTIAQFEAIADKIKASGKYPLASGWSGLWRSSYPLELLVPSFSGPEFYQQLMSMKTDWGDPRVVKALEIWKRWVDKKYWYPDPRSRRWAEGLTLFRNGEAGMYILGTYGDPMLKSAGWEVGKDFDAFLFPQDNSQYPMTLTGPFDTWCMAARAPHPTEANRLLAFLASKGPQTMRAEYHGGLAANKDVTAYDKIGTMVRDAMNGGAVFHQIIGNALPDIGVQLINKGATVDFYDSPDINQFIKTANSANAQYAAENK